MDNGSTLVGILMVLYAAIVVFLTINKPKAVWNMKKIKTFEKIFGEKGTVVFFYIWALLFLVIGIWILAR